LPTKSRDNLSHCSTDFVHKINIKNDFNDHTKFFNEQGNRNKLDEKYINNSSDNLPNWEPNHQLLDRVTYLDFQIDLLDVSPKDIKISIISNIIFIFFNDSSRYYGKRFSISFKIKIK